MANDPPTIAPDMGWGHAPLVLDEISRRRIANRMMVQPPKSVAEVKEFQRFQAAHTKLMEFPPDVLLVLESMLLLAEQGNELAQIVYMTECDRWGITFARRWDVKPMLERA